MTGIILIILAGRIVRVQRRREPFVRGRTIGCPMSIRRCLMVVIVLLFFFLLAGTLVVVVVGFIVYSQFLTLDLVDRLNPVGLFFLAIFVLLLLIIVVVVISIFFLLLLYLSPLVLILILTFIFRSTPVPMNRQLKAEPFRST
jgi:phosphatidylserine synthase